MMRLSRPNGHLLVCSITVCFYLNWLYHSFFCNNKNVNHMVMKIEFININSAIKYINFVIPARPESSFVYSMISRSIPDKRE